MVKADSGEPVDMGSSYDFFSEISHYSSTEVTKEQKANRELLRKTMVVWFSTLSPVMVALHL